jgi:GNAT superfamily N-acetyltransferase
MQPRQVTLKNGIEIVVKPAHIHGFIPGDPMPEGVSISVHCGWDFQEGQSHFSSTAPLFAAWHRAQARALGTDYSMILALKGGEIIGFLSFCAAAEGKPALELPTGFDKCCPYEEQSDEEAREINALCIQKVECDTIMLTCAKSVAPSLKRHGVATAMLRYLIDIAKEHGWRHIRAVAHLPETPDDFWPPMALMEAVGFRRVGPLLELDGGRVHGYEVCLDV